MSARENHTTRDFPDEKWGLLIVYERFECRSHFMSSWNMIIQVIVVLNRTVVHSHCQQQSIQDYSYPENYIPPTYIIILLVLQINSCFSFLSTFTLLSLFATTFHHFYCIIALLCLISALLLKK